MKRTGHEVVFKPETPETIMTLYCAEIDEVPPAEKPLLASPVLLWIRLMWEFAVKPLLG